jgi:putative ABC transport system ATP-binding protein
MVPLFALNQVSFGHPGAAPVFRDVSLDIVPGSFVLVRGPSGAGKSTLLRLLCRLEEPTSGTILFDGRPVSELSPELLRRQVPYTQQQPVLLPGSVRENLLLPFTFTANKDLPKPDDATLEGHIKSFHLRGVSLDQEAPALSVGQRQRLCLIRAMLLSPRALLLDEPTAALDPESAAAVHGDLLRLHAQGLTIVIVSHGEWRPAIRHTTLTVADGRVEGS